MIEVKDLKIIDDIAYFNYKSDLDDDFKSVAYNLKTNEIIESNVKHISSTRSTYIYHAVMTIKKLRAKGDTRTSFIEQWF